MEHTGHPLSNLRATPERREDAGQTFRSVRNRERAPGPSVRDRDRANAARTQFSKSSVGATVQRFAAALRAQSAGFIAKPRRCQCAQQQALRAICLAAVGAEGLC